MSLDQIRFDEPQAGLVRLAARFGGHAYDLHRHETYAVGLTLWGAQSFHYRGSLQTSRGGQVMVIHPDEAHDGHASNNQGGVDNGFAYRMLYVDPASVSAALDGASPPFVPDVVADDPALAELLREAFADFPQALEPLAVDAVVERLADLLAARSDDCVRSRRSATAHRAVARARAFLAAEAHRTVASEELEKVTGLDRFALARHFRAVTGTSPHRYQVGRRLARAQTMIAAGIALSETAAATGFADQSHLTRHFSARFGLTPGRWATLARRAA
jgi:AraC-like DNA-binding protein